MKNRILFIPVLFLIFALTMSACGSGSGSGGSNNDGTDISNGGGGSVAGSWSISGTSSVTSESSPGLCSDSIGPWSDTAVVTQTGDSLSAVIDGNTFTGTIDATGSVVTWTGSYPDTEGTTTEETTATVSDDENSISGTTTWSWSDSYENSCSGTSTFSGTSDGSDGDGTDISDGSDGGNGDGTDISDGSGDGNDDGACSEGSICDSVGGNWSISGTSSVITESSPSLCDDSIGDWSKSAVVTQTGDSLSAVISGNTFTGARDGNVITWKGSYPDTGGTTTEELSATVSDDGNSISGTTAWSWIDSYENYCSGESSFSGTRL